MVFNEYMHVGIVVSDLDKTLKTLEEGFCIGPFSIINFPPENIDPSEIEMSYHGKPADFKAKFCFAQFNGTEIEIIQPISGENVWFDFLREKGDGIHHIKFRVKSLRETRDKLAEQGIEMIQSGSAVGANLGKTWAYFESKEQPGMIFEVLNDIIGEKII